MKKKKKCDVGVATSGCKKCGIFRMEDIILVSEDDSCTKATENIKRERERERVWHRATFTRMFCHFQPW